MTVLVVYSEHEADRPEVINEPAKIAERLGDLGVLFERWQAGCEFSTDAAQEEVIAAYRSQVDRLMAKYDFKSVDVISLKPDHPERVALRNKFLGEHVHADFEVRFFVEGKGLFYIHAGEAVYGLMCEAGDLISVPDSVSHWFDMGESPDFKCIRLFTTPEGWVANYTGSSIAARFPSFENFQAQYS